MNKNFEWTRFCKVVRKDFNNIWQNAGTSLLIITLLPMAVWLLWWALSRIGDMSAIAPEFRWAFIYGVVILAAMVTPSRMYRTCNLPKEGIYFAMLPASKLEKYLSMLLYSIIVCPLLCLFGSIVLDYFLTLLPFGPYSKWLWQTDHLADYLDSYKQLTAGSFPNVDENTILLAQTYAPGTMLLYVIIGYLNTVSLYLFTTTIFKKHKVLQTLLWTFLITFVLELIFLPIITAMMLNGNLMEEMMAAADPIRTMNIAYGVATVLSLVLTTLFFWWASYRLKRMKY